MSLADDIRQLPVDRRENKYDKLAAANRRDWEMRKDRERNAPAERRQVVPTEFGEMVKGGDGQLYSKETGMHYGGKGTDGMTFADVHGARDPNSKEQMSLANARAHGVRSYLQKQ